MAVTVIGFPLVAVRPGLLPASPEGAAIDAPDTSQLRENPARSVKKDFKTRPFSYLRCKAGTGLLAACYAASVPPWQRTGDGT